MAFNNNLHFPIYTDEDLHFYPSSNYEPFYNSFHHPFDSSYYTSHYTPPIEVIPSPESFDPFYSEPIFDSPVGYGELLHYDAFHSTNEYNYPDCSDAFNSSVRAIPDFRASYYESAPTSINIVKLYEKTAESQKVQTRFHNLSDDDFSELDPTPYGGGYDIVSTYGKPLSASDATCYPRSPRENAVPKKVTFLLPSSPINEGNRAPSLPIVDSNRKEQPKEKDNMAPPPATGDGNRKDTAKEGGEGKVGSVIDPWRSERDGEKHGMEINVHDHMPYGYGLESMDICETIFGPWPCLNPNLRRDCCCCRNRRGYYREANGNPWTRAADYLFGDPNPYSSNYGNSYRYNV